MVLMARPRTGICREIDDFQQEVMLRSSVVLLVEDEALIGELIPDALAEHGFGVRMAVCADEALAYLESGAPADVLFTDINLPGGMDGASLVATARRMRPGLPVIYASGRWNLIEKLRGEAGSVVLPKPYSPARACSAVGKPADAEACGQPIDASGPILTFASLFGGLFCEC
jgi:CheY-like chemotaxis protein